MKKLISIFLLVGLIGGGLVCKNHFMIKEEKTITTHPLVTVTLSNHTTFKIRLYPEEAPNTVCNFIELANCGFYENLGFSKILPNYFVQTGDTIGNGTGFPGYFIQSECEANGFDNDLACEMGTVCMARGDKFNTEGSQFFILLCDAPELEGDYTAFGKVVTGLEHLMTLEEEEGIVITHMDVQTFKQHYEEPKVLSMVEVRDTLR